MKRSDLNEEVKCFHQTVVIFLTDNNGITVFCSDVDGFIIADRLLKQIENIFSEMSYIDIQHSLILHVYIIAYITVFVKEKRTILRTLFLDKSLEKSCQVWYNITAQKLIDNKHPLISGTVAGWSSG